MKENRDLIVRYAHAMFYRGTRPCFSFIAVTQYDVRAFRARQGKEYKVIDDIINSTAAESRDVRSTDRYRFQTDKSLPRQRSVKY